jgi:hypothetical protein
LEPEVSPSRGRQQSHRPRHDVRHDQAGVRPRRLVNAGYSEFLLFEEVTEQSFDKVIAVNFKGLHVQKPCRYSGKARL